MANGNIQIQITKVWILGPAIVWHEAGDVAVLKVLGFKIYQRLGDLRWLCGYAWRDTHRAA